MTNNGRKLAYSCASCTAIEFSVEYVVVDQKKFCCDRKALLCTPHTDAIRIHHGLDFSHDKQSQHSKTICRKCYMRLAKLKRTDSEYTARAAKHDIENSLSIWTDFDPFANK